MRSQTVTIIAIFTSLIIASDYVLAPVYNVKLMDTLVFSSSYAFGFKIGAAVAILSESIWSVVNPTGFSLPIIPFLAFGEVLFALAGYFSFKLWGAEKISLLSPRNIFFGAVLAITAFVWDLETNIATGLLVGARSLPLLLGYELVAGPFIVPHEISDFIFGSTLAPVIIVYFLKYSGRIKNNSQVAPVASGSILGGN